MKEWLKDVTLRTVKTMAETALGIISSSALLSQIDWKLVASSTAVAGLCTILLNIKNYGEK